MNSAMYTPRIPVSYTHLDVYKRQAESLNEKISRYKTEWLLEVKKMDTTRFSRKAFNYHPKKKKSTGRPVNDG